MFIDYLRKHPTPSCAGPRGQDTTCIRPSGTSWTEAQAERHLRSLELFGMRFGLDRMRRMMTALGLARAALRRDPRARHQRQVLDHAHDRGDPRAPRPAHGRLHLSAPGLLPRARADRRARAGRGRLRRGDRPRGVGGRARQPHAGEDDHVTQFELLTAAALWEMAEREVRGGGRRGRARRTL